MNALNEKANFHLVPMIRQYNTRGGFNENLFKETGYVNSVKFEDGTVKHGPEYSVVESLKEKQLMPHLSLVRTRSQSFPDLLQRTCLKSL